MRTYGKPQIKATSTCPSANSSKDCPTSRVVWQPTLTPTYLVICAYVEYIMGERHVAKRIGVVLSSIRHPQFFQSERNSFCFSSTCVPSTGCNSISGEYLLAGTVFPKASAMART